MKKVSPAFIYRIIFVGLILVMLIINGIVVPALLGEGSETTDTSNTNTSASETLTETVVSSTEALTVTTETHPITETPTTTTPVSTTEEYTHAVEAPPFYRSEELQKLITPLAATPVDYTYFDNSVFLGDSVTLGFQMHVNNLKKAKKYDFPSTHFICGKSYGVYNALREIGEKTVHPLYEGEQRYPWDVIKIYTPEKVFISFGLNDVGMLTKTRYISDYITLINKIRAQLPHVQIIILSITPLTEEGQLKTLNNEKINEYNNALITMAYENNCSFVDIAEAVRDINGHLPAKLSSDNYCHLTFESYEKIIQYHMAHPAVLGRYPDIVLPGVSKPDVPAIAIPTTTAAPKPPAATKAQETTKVPETTKAPLTTIAPTIAATAPPATTQPATPAPTTKPTAAPTTVPATSTSTTVSTQPITEQTTDVSYDIITTEPYIDTVG